MKQISFPIYPFYYVFAVTNPWLAVLLRTLAQGMFDEALQTLVTGWTSIDFGHRLNCRLPPADYVVRKGVEDDATMIGIRDCCNRLKGDVPLISSSSGICHCPN